MAKEGWEGGEVLFAGGTDWAKVLVHVDTKEACTHNAPCADTHAVLYADCQGRKQQETK